MKSYDDKADRFVPKLGASKSHEEQIIDELKDCGFSFWQLKSLEVRHLVDFLESNEHILAAVYGYNTGNDRCIIVGTNMRIVYMDYVPMFRSVDEMSYANIQGVTYVTNVLRSTVTLHPSHRDLTLRWVRSGMARRFIDYIEMKSVEV